MSAPANRVAPWEDIVLRLIALWKLLNATFFTAVGLGLLKLRHHNVVEFLNNYVIIPFHLNPESPLNPESGFIDKVLEQAAKVTPHALFLLGWAAFLYAALFAAEGIGLYLRWRWAEWLVVVVTGSLLPLEIYEFFHKAAMWKFAAIAGNLLIVCYLIHRITLDSRVKAQRLERENREAQANSPSGLNGHHPASGNRAGSTKPVATKSR